MVGPTVRQKRSSAGCYCGKNAPKFTDEDLKIRPGYAGGVLPVAPPNHLSMLHDYIEPSERAGACPNQDVTCGQMVLSLDRDAVVIQVPDFGNRFWVYQIVDQRSDAFAEIGKMYGSKPGFYLLAAADWKGTVPNGVIKVFRTSTRLGNPVDGQQPSRSFSRSGFGCRCVPRARASGAVPRQRVRAP